MKKKYMALLLAAAMTVTSLNATAMAVSAADFDSEEETSVELNEEMPVVSSDETDVQTEQDEVTNSAEISFDEPESADENAQVEIQEDGDAEADFEDAGELSDGQDGSEIAMQDDQTKKAVQSIRIEKGAAATEYYEDLEMVSFSGSFINITYEDGSTARLQPLGKTELYDDYGNKFKIICTNGEKIYEFKENYYTQMPSGTYAVTVEGYKNVTTDYSFTIRPFVMDSSNQLLAGENKGVTEKICWFRPETTGVYIFGGMRNAAVNEIVDGSYNGVLNSGNQSDCRYSLKKGSVYTITTPASQKNPVDLTISMEKQITGIQFTPDKFCGVSPCNRWSWCELRISGTLTLTYEDGTTETISSRKLNSPVSEWGAQD